ncbi:E3 ubiquitin-protein ligase Siah2-like [Homalodisca vitripennis]|nr:E3 ubiquitin-protein ligase Siah2-like [Homalodisca vitripennis]KAG8258737.1 hypothetical protein J6590_025901 [Homalodisca vitripennis]
MDDIPVEVLRHSFQSLMEISRCSVCLENVRAEVVQCAKGHLFCNHCRKDLKKCPKCKKHFVKDNPSRYANKVVAALPVLCRYKKCGKYLEPGDDHEKYCGYRPTGCKICDWTGLGHEILIHMKGRHIVHVIGENNPGIGFQNCIPNKITSTVSVLSAYGIFFWMIERHDVEKQTFNVTFYPILSGKPQNDFYVTLSSGGTHFVTKFKLDMDPKNGENRLFVPGFMFHNLLDEKGSLNYKIFITTE